MKLNGWAQIGAFIFAMTGLVTWVITADNRLHDRCDSLEKNNIEHMKTETDLKICITELQGDIDEIHTILRLTFPEAAKEAKELNGDST